jgi:hypothetical protein
MLLYFSEDIGFNELRAPDLLKGAKFEVPKNQTGSISVCRFDSKHNHRPAYSVCLSNLIAENGTLGIFKTALHKTVRIRDLEIRLHRYPFSKTGRNPNKQVPSSTVPVEGTVEDLKKLIKESSETLRNPEDQWRINSVDLSNASEVQINGFGYKIFSEGNLCLSITSKRAIASHKHSYIELRGHVEITTGQGNTLESNFVKWDVDKHHFVVKGSYVLNREGLQEMGKGVCVDWRLNVLGAKNVKSVQKEKSQWFAKL